LICATVNIVGVIDFDRHPPSCLTRLEIGRSSNKDGSKFKKTVLMYAKQGENCIKVPCMVGYCDMDRSFEALNYFRELIKMRMNNIPGWPKIQNSN